MYSFHTQYAMLKEISKWSTLNKIVCHYTLQYSLSLFCEHTEWIFYANEKKNYLHSLLQKEY